MDVEGGTRCGDSVLAGMLCGRGRFKAISLQSGHRSAAQIQDKMPVRKIETLQRIET